MLSEASNMYFYDRLPTEQGDHDDNGAQCFTAQVRGARMLIIRRTFPQLYVALFLTAFSFSTDTVVWASVQRIPEL